MYRIGIDLGGTNIVIGLVNEQYEILGKKSIKTNLPKSPEVLCEDIAALIQDFLKEQHVDPDEIASFGIGSPGIINTDSGIIVSASNFRYINVPIRQLLKEKSGYDFHCINDANAAAYGEFLAGSGKGSRHFIALTIGTGIGGGVIINREIYTGAGYAGGELGHMVIFDHGPVCACGRSGCFETLASANALIRNAKNVMPAYRSSLLWNLCDGDISRVNGEIIFKAHAGKDPAAVYALETYIHDLGVGIYNLFRIFQPEILCIGGGISNQGDHLLELLDKELSSPSYGDTSARVTRLKIASLGNDAGIIGAAFAP